MPPASSASRTSGRSIAPSHAASTGLLAPRVTVATARAASVGPIEGRGTCSTTTASTFASARTAATARREALGRRIGAHIDRIAALAFVREQRVERAKRRRIELREPDVALAGRVRGEKRRAAAVCDDREPVAARNAPERKDARRREELRVGSYAHGTGATNGSFEYRVRGRRVSALRRLVRSPGLENDHRLGSRGRTQCGQEPPGVAHRFDVQQDAVGLAIEQQAIEHFAEVDVDAGAKRHHRREADVAAARRSRASPCTRRRTARSVQAVRAARARR